MTTYQKWVLWTRRNQDTVYGAKYRELFSRLRYSPASLRERGECVIDW